MSRIVVTGAHGFVGRALCRALIEAGYDAIGLVRRRAGSVGGVREWVYDAPDFIDLAQAWPPTLHAQCVVHLAARVHLMRDTAADPLAAFRATNVEGTLRVAQTAYQKGVRRIVYVSSIKALAERSGQAPLSEADTPRPQDAYGRSKYEAEQALWQFGRETGLEIVIVRAPLVYGPGVRANFLRLMRSVARGVPLPLGAIDARRSLLYVDNLADALVRCATEARAANQCFHVADEEDLTVTEFVRAMGRHLGKPARLIAVPPRWLRAVGRWTGYSASIERLTDELRVDTSHIHKTLDWDARYCLEDGLAATAHWYRSMHCISRI